MLNFLVILLKALARSYAGWRSRERAYAELCALDDRSLADIGITRGEIRYLLSQGKAERRAEAVLPARPRGLRQAA